MISQSFDMDTYIKQRLAEITDSDERVFAREVLLKGLLPAFRTMEERYRELENRIKREVEIDSSCFSVLTTIIRRQDYDPTNHTWYPVSEYDVQEEGPVCRKLFFHGNEEERQAFEEKASLSAADGMGNVHRLGVRRAEDYRCAVETLYHVFVYNRIPWNTVNMGYLDRFYEIYPLEEAEGMEDWEISYGQWEPYVDPDYMAVWNIEKFYFHCMRFMVPSLDGKYYEHELNLEDYDKDSGYMVEGNEDILNIRYENGRIIMVSMKETFENWSAYRFGSLIDTDSYGYRHAILGNRKKECFADCLAERYGQGIHTRTEIFRIVEGLDADGYIKMTDCNIREQEREGSVSADMNWFIREEAFPMETRRILELQFVRQADMSSKGDCHAEDMLRYVVSQVQLFLDEYKCVGVLI